MAARNAPSTFPAGLVNACGAVNASSIVPASTSAARNSKPSVAAAGGTGDRPSTPSQNAPDRPINSASSISSTTATVGRRGRAVVDEFHPRAVGRFRVTFADVTASAAMSAGPVVPDGDR